MMQICKPYSAAELKVILEFMEVKSLSTKVRRKTSNYASSVETLSDTVVTIFVLPAHIKHTLVFASLSIVFTGLIVFFYMLHRQDVLRKPYNRQHGLS